MKKRILIILVLAFIIGPISRVAEAKLVACVGDSITYGEGIPDRNDNSYPVQLATILKRVDSQWETENFGVSGATLLRNGGKPYMKLNAYNLALASEPEVVVIMLGSNDSVRTSAALKQYLIPDYLALIDAFAQLPSQPKIFICYPPPIPWGQWAYCDPVIKGDIIPLINQVGELRDVELIDLYTPMEGLSRLFPDGIHPNAEGAGIMAEIVAQSILGFRFHLDFNNDQIVDIEDLIILIEHWGQDEPSVDIVLDGIIDANDLEVLMSYWQREIFPFELIEYWKLDEEEGDIAYNSISDNYGILSGEPSWQPGGGQVAGTLEFDGINDYVETDFALDPANGAFSAFAWIQGGAPRQVIISQLDGMGTGNIWLGVDALGGNLMTGLVPPPVGRFVAQPLISQSIITDGQWHHIGFVWDGSYRTLYMDGTEVIKDTNPLVQLKYSYGGLYIGVNKNLDVGTFFSGLIDDVRIYNVALTPEQIATMVQ